MYYLANFRKIGERVRVYMARNDVGTEGLILLDRNSIDVLRRLGCHLASVTIGTVVQPLNLNPQGYRVVKVRCS